MHLYIIAFKGTCPENNTSMVRFSSFIASVNGVIEFVKPGPDVTIETFLPLF